METYVHKQDNSNYLNDNMLQKINKLCSAARPEERQGVMYSSRVYRKDKIQKIVEELLNTEKAYVQRLKLLVEVIFCCCTMIFLQLKLGALDSNCSTLKIEIKMKFKLGIS
jgi:hypothetical protein